MIKFKTYYCLSVFDKYYQNHFRFDHYSSFEYHFKILIQDKRNVIETWVETTFERIKD